MSQAKSKQQPLQLPFAAVAGQHDFKLALLLAAINPFIGGVLVSGPRGSAKSTLAKGLADILPNVNGQRKPFVSLPLGASEEMLIGTLNLQQVLDEKKVDFQPGLLAKADNGVLYVDEVNLLPDHLVDQLLDVAASGVNVIERDGISHQHSSSFILLGTMNPEEGDLRPQLQDRFGLSVALSNQYSLEERMDIVRLREQFDKNPSDFIHSYNDQQVQISQAIVQASALLAEVTCPDDCRHLIAERCHQANVDGLRADIVWYQAAIAYTAYQQRTVVSKDDVLAVENLVLEHRRQSPPPSPSSPPPPESPTFSKPTADRQQSSVEARESSLQQESQQNVGDWGAMSAGNQEAQCIDEDVFSASSAPLTALSRRASMRISNAAKREGKVHWFSSIAANAGSWPLSFLKFSLPQKQAQILHVFVLDTSASIVNNSGFAKAKGLVLNIANQAYIDREKVAIIGFGKQSAELLLDRRRSPNALRDFLNAIPAAGGTPLVDALNHASKFHAKQFTKTPELQVNTYIVTDGRVNHLPHDSGLKGDVFVIDVEQSTVKRGKAKAIADRLQAHYFPLTAFC